MSAPIQPMSRRALMSRRRKSLWLIVPAATATGGAAGVPTPGLEAPKQLFVTAADVALMASIYNIYFDEEIGAGDMVDVLKEAGILVVVGGGLVYGGIKLTEAGLAEVLNFVPGVGWAASGLITASVTASVATFWWWYCDRQARAGTIPLAGPHVVAS